MRRLPILVALATLFTTTAFMGSAFATTLNLRDLPSDTAKITGTIDLAGGVIPIYTPPDSQWIKIADPHNGNTGWVKSSELKDSKGNIITFSQKVGDDGKSQSVEMSYGSGQPLTAEQKEQLADQQKQAQESLLKLQQNAVQMLKDVKKVYDQQSELLQKSGFPIMMPPMPNIPVPNPVPQVQQQTSQGTQNK